MDINNLPKLDRRVQFDERSRLYRAVQGVEDKPLRTKQWECSIHNDQGSEGACVGFAWSHELSAKPKVIETNEAGALEIYRRARELDSMPGEDYSGTSVLAGIKAVQEIENSKGNPLIREYRWAFGVEDVLRSISWLGPVVLGIEWHSSHYTPDENGQIWLNNDVVGGHAILAKGFNLVKINPDGPDTFDNVDQHKSLVTLHNSWGTSYGNNGDCFISVYDLSYLLGRNGEACIPTRRAQR